MVKGTTDDEHKVVGEQLSVDEIFSIGNDSAMANHDTLGAACSARSEENVGSTFRNGGAVNEPADVMETLLGHIALQRHGYCTENMYGEIMYEEVYVLRDTEHYGLTSLNAIGTHRLDVLPHPLIKGGIGQFLTIANDCRLVGIELGIATQIIFENHLLRV